MTTSKEPLEVLYKYASAYADVSQQPQMQSTLLRYKNEIISEVNRLKKDNLHFTLENSRLEKMLEKAQANVEAFQGEVADCKSNCEITEASEWSKVDLNGHHFLVHPSGAVRRDITSQLKKESDDE